MVLSILTSPLLPLWFFFQWVVIAWASPAVTHSSRSSTLMVLHHHSSPRLKGYDSGRLTLFPPSSLNLANRKSPSNWDIWLAQMGMWPTSGQGDSAEGLLLELLRKRSFYTDVAEWMDCNLGHPNTPWQEIVQLKSKLKKAEPSYGKRYIPASSNLWILAWSQSYCIILNFCDPINFIFINPVWDGILLLVTKRAITNISPNAVVLIT